MPEHHVKNIFKVFPESLAARNRIPKVNRIDSMWADTFPSFLQHTFRSATNQRAAGGGPPTAPAESAPGLPALIAAPDPQKIRERVETPPGLNAMMVQSGAGSQKRIRLTGHALQQLGFRGTDEAEVTDAIHSQMGPR